MNHRTGRKLFIKMHNANNCKKHGPQENHTIGSKIIVKRTLWSNWVYSRACSVNWNLLYCLCSLCFLDVVAVLALEVLWSIPWWRISWLTLSAARKGTSSITSPSLFLRALRGESDSNVRALFLSTVWWPEPCLESYCDGCERVEVFQDCIWLRLLLHCPSAVRL